MTLKELFTVLTYGDEIALFKRCDGAWLEFAEFTNSEALEDLILGAYGDWKVFNQGCNGTYRMIAVYSDPMAEEISGLDCKKWSFSN